MDSELWATIRRMRAVDKQSISAIARQLRIHRDTVRRALASEAGPPANEPRGRQPANKLEQYRAYLAGRLAEYPALRARKLLLEIRKQGYAGGYTILKEHVRQCGPTKSRRPTCAWRRSPASTPRWTGRTSARSTSATRGGSYPVS